MSTALSGDSLLFAKRVTLCRLSLLREAQGELASPNTMRHLYRESSSKGRGKSAEKPDGGGDESYGRSLIRTQMPEHGSINHLHGDE